MRVAQQSFIIILVDFSEIWYSYKMLRRRDNE